MTDRFHDTFSLQTVTHGLDETTYDWCLKYVNQHCQSWKGALFFRQTTCGYQYIDHASEECIVWFLSEGDRFLVLKPSCEVGEDFLAKPEGKQKHNSLLKVLS